MRQLSFILASAALVVYPLLVYLGLGTVGPAWLIAGLLLLALARCLVVPARGRRAAILSLAAIAVLLATIILVAGQVMALRFYPVGVSAVLFVTFAGSLFSRQPLIERLARLQEPDLPAEGVAYTRRLTIAWSLLIFLNGLVALWTALFASMETWALYNGLVSYLVLGAFFALEFLYRQFHRKSAERA